ncbi:hypothetical protein A4X13_0g3742 [Tilletia indica]|uniref:DUF7918 domain-containing protein n=1 Tax=Tilletia indica TaxID=43049 RepID=A0A177TD79_9BASI|nr:hypothetical protein A4X13_0g3742 [Tilletia indica]
MSSGASMRNTSSLSQAASNASMVPTPDSLISHLFKFRLLDSTGKAMPLYDIKRCKNDHVHAYVEATEGEQFSVAVDTFCPFDKYAAFLYLGGQHVAGHLVTNECPANLSERQISKNEAQSLIFSKPNVTDDEVDSVRDQTEVARLGEIQVEVMKVAQSSAPSPTKFPEAPIGPEKAVHERAKQFGAVHFGAGPTVRKPEPQRVNCTYDSTFKTVRFVIHCATRTGLELKGIIPMEATASPPKKRSREEEEIEAEEQRLQKALETLKKRRRVIVGDAENASNAATHARGDKDTRAVKREPSLFDFSTGGTASNPLTL